MLMQRFWWGHKENSFKIHWMSWEKMGTSKDQGGLGFRDLIMFNKALLIGHANVENDAKPGGLGGLDYER